MTRFSGYCSAQTCASCGACMYLSRLSKVMVVSTPYGCCPKFAEGVELPAEGRGCCPGLGINYPELYRWHYKREPESWLTGVIEKVRTGYASDADTRLKGASGGVITRTLQYLLETGRIDGAILARQGIPTPMEASPFIATTAEEILACAGSVYIPVPMLSVLGKLESGKVYAMSCTPEVSAALRALQKAGDARALQIQYVVGPYTGTALMPAALSYYLKSNRVPKDDEVTSVQWRAGVWPGYLEIQTRSGRVLQSPKVYYNFLIPFFVTNTSLLSMDFCNEFADLAVGDAWSPKFENAGQGGVSIVVTRTPEMEAILTEMREKKLVTLTDEEPTKAMDMHGHMLDFKKRGGYLRCSARRVLGLAAPSYGYRPAHIAFSRRCVEAVISTVFALCRTRVARWLVCLIPERILGPFFNRLRLTWKALSRPTKRKGLTQYEVRLEGVSKQENKHATDSH